MGIILAITPEPSIGTVVMTGVSLVFLILVALAVIITCQGKIFDTIADNKKKKAEAEKAAKVAAMASAAPAPAAPAPAPAAPAPAAKAAPAVEEEPEIEAGIPQEVIAAIVAALACMGGGKYKLRALRKAERSRWGTAGVISDTEPF